MTELERLKDVFELLGIGGEVSTWTPEGVPQKSVEHITASGAGMSGEALKTASASVSVSDVKFYFDRKGHYLGYVGGDEQPHWEERSPEPFRADKEVCGCSLIECCGLCCTGDHSAHVKTFEETGG